MFRRLRDSPLTSVQEAVCGTGYVLQLFCLFRFCLRVFLRVSVLFLFASSNSLLLRTVQHI